VGASIGAAAAAGVAPYVSNRAQSDAQEALAAAERNAQEARKAMAPDRTADLLVQLIRAVEADIAAAEKSSTPGVTVRSLEAKALCRALWGHRNLFATTWALYCGEGTEPLWIDHLLASGELFPRMRDELQTALDQLDHEDRSA
jgi:hypothetical protein